MTDWSKTLGTAPRIPLDQLLAGTMQAPLDTFNFDYPGSGAPGNGNDQALASIDSDDLLNHILARQAKGLPPLPDYSTATAPDTARARDEALASIQNDDLLNHILARQAAGLRPLPDYSTTTQTLPPGWLLAGVQPAPLQQLNYASSPRNPPNDAGLNPSDDWQKRGDSFQPIPPEQLRAGIQPAVLVTTGAVPSNRTGQVQQPVSGARGLSQMRTDLAWQQNMKKQEGDFYDHIYDPTHKGDYTIGFGHKISSTPRVHQLSGQTYKRGRRRGALPARPCGG